MFDFFKRKLPQASASAVIPEAPPEADPLVDAVLMSGVVLPPYPALLTELDHLMARDDFELPRLVELVGRDPSLTAALLRVANSPVFGLRQSVSGLLQAISVLGLARARAVLTSAVLREVLREYGAPALVQTLWRRFSEIGELATSLASHSSLLKTRADLAYTTGMFHGTGSFILIKRFPRETSVLAHAEADFEATIAQLDAELGTDHAAIGAMVARGWRLPPEVVKAIAQQHQSLPASGAADPGNRLTYLLRLAIALHDGVAQSADWPVVLAAADEFLGLDQAALDAALEGAGRAR